MKICHRHQKLLLMPGRLHRGSNQNIRQASPEGIRNVFFPFYSLWIRYMHITHLQHPQHAGAGAAPIPNTAGGKGTAQHTSSRVAAPCPRCISTTESSAPGKGHSALSEYAAHAKHMTEHSPSSFSASQLLLVDSHQRWRI